MDQESLRGEPRPFSAEHAAYLVKWLRILFFWSLFSGITVGALKYDPIQIWIDSVFLNPQIITVCLELAGPAGAAFLFAKLGRMSSYYRCIMFLQIASVAVKLTLLGKGPNSPTWWAMSVLGLILGVVISHQYYHGHAEMLDMIHSALAEKWRKLWKWCVRLILGLPVGVLTALAFPTLGGILLMVSMLGLAILGILEFIYLWQTGSAFRDYAPEGQVLLMEAETL